MEAYCQRAKLADGQRILDLGCGWGSLALYMAKADYICRQVSERGLTNVQVTTGNIVDFEWDKPREFDRIVTIEMIEHMKNYAQLFAKVSRWLTPDGYMFAETLSHREVPYHFDVGEEDSWLARYFFTGGCMPSRDLYLYFQDHLQLVDQWYLNGTHFNKTGEAWLINLDRHSEEALVALTRIYASKELAALDFISARTIAYKWLQRWRVYLMAVSEMYAFGNYQEWGITHHLFQNRRRPVLPLQA
ncbi:hypothetical protein IWQ60_012099 [Tieghemiomyces parasiticus]|uniref:Cyclopropane-fatty-acyl-phospholipid synthase n=1 Tax=Tieghemiomyces parasiticus TaxID=78921 RepID=A0A9W8DHW0_9FUNG|nr:hypothetical protein IWQ60_012099 [Tieghemiomyces parasiticus]